MSVFQKQKACIIIQGGGIGIALSEGRHGLILH